MTSECADCKKLGNEHEMYYIRRPYQKDDWGKLQASSFNMCTQCWDKMIGLAVMQAIR